MLQSTLLFLFILTRTFEHELLNLLIKFQNKLRLQDLDIHKDVYQKREKQLYKFNIIRCSVIFSPPILIWICLIANKFPTKGKLILLATIWSAVFTMSLYSSTVLSLWWNMYKFHRVSFRHHFWQ